MIRFNRSMGGSPTWNRADHLDRLRGEFDVLVIGGGIVRAERPWRRSAADPNVEHSAARGGTSMRRR
ncbi:MAG: hypothetical protein V3V29_05135, partial [Acidimicrobiia bacterium]